MMVNGITLRCALLLLLFLITNGAQAQLLPSKNLVARSKWARFEVVLGRLRLVEARLTPKATLTSSDPDTGAQQYLTFAAASADTPTLRYEYLDPHQRLTVDMDHTRVVSISRTAVSQAGVPTVRFRQTAGGEVSLAVDDQNVREEHGAGSFWHLLLDEPELCDRYLIPILEFLRPDWRLKNLRQRVETALYASARSGTLPDQRRMEDLIADFRSPEFAERQAADRQLRAMGQSVIAFLERLDERGLSAEQRIRVRRIKRDLIVQDGDTPARVASWLVEDKSVWVALLDDKEAHRRTLATRHLARLAGEPVPFDPLADASVRQTQLQQLRNEFLTEIPILVGDGGRTRIR